MADLEVVIKGTIQSNDKAISWYYRFSDSFLFLFLFLRSRRTSITSSIKFDSSIPDSYLDFIVDSYILEHNVQKLPLLLYQLLYSV